MTTSYGNRIKVTVTSTGTGTAQLGSAVSGFQDFSGLTSGTTVGYAIDDGANWEVGVGTYTSGSPSTVTRTNIEASTNGGAAINLSGSAQMMLTTTAAQTNNPSIQTISITSGNVGSPIQLVGNVSTGDTNQGAQIQIQNANASSGVQNKYIRVDSSGILGILNSAYSAAILSLTDAGSLSATAINSTPIGSTTASTGAFTTLSASSTVSGTGFTNYLASPPAIGGTAPNTGTFTTLNANPINLSAAAGNYRNIVYQTAGANRWIFATNNTSESGSNAGSNLEIKAYNDSGTWLFDPIDINRATGMVTMAKGAAISGGSLDNAPVGSTTASTGTFTTLTATGALSGGTNYGAANSNPAIQASNGAYAIYLVPRDSSGGYNPLVQAGDAAIIAGQGSNNTGNLVLGVWNSSSYGIRISSAGAVTLGGASGSITATSLDNTPIGGTTPAAGTFTGLTVGTNSGNTTSVINGGAGSSRNLFFNSASVNRWLIYTDNATESGSNVGSDFHIARYSDAGSLIDTPISITRSTGTVAIGTLSASSLSLSGAQTISSGSLSSSAPVSLTTNAQTTSGNVLNFASTTGVAVGQTVFGTNIPDSTTVASTTSTTVTLSQNVGGTVANGATIRFVSILTQATFQDTVSNTGLLRIYDWRNASGTTWTTATRRLGLRIDVTDQAFIEFSPPSYSGGFGIGVGSPGTATYALSVNSSGAIASINIDGGTIDATPIGGSSPSTGAFTTLSASSTVSGTGFSTYLASPPSIGNTAANSGAFTTLSASSTVSGTGFSTYLASPPAIGGTSPSTGAFTTLSASSTVSGTGFQTYLSSNAVQKFTIPNTLSTAQWILLGTFTPNANTGDKCWVEIVAGSGYNAQTTQDQITTIYFKGSNGTSVDGNGFAGDSYWHAEGIITAPSAVKWVANAAGTSATTFSLYANFATFSGQSAFYTVEVGSGTWVNLCTMGQADPGSASSTVCVATNQQIFASAVTANAGLATTTLSASSTVSGTGFSTYLASPPAIGGTAAAAGSFTTLSASSTVSGTGFSTYLASPPPIGSTAANTGAFTTLTATDPSTSSIGSFIFSASSDTNGINLRLVGNGATTPAKTIRVINGQFQIINDAYTASIFQVTDAGSLSTIAINNTPIGSTTASTGAFTTLSASSTVSGTGFSTYLASPPAIGGTAANTGAFTTLTATTPSTSDSSTNVATTAMVQSRLTTVATINTTGGTTTLTAAQYDSEALLITGALTSNATLVVPNSGRWLVSNRTSGAFTVTVKTSAGTGVTVSQSFNNAVMADGTNVVYSDNDLSYGPTIVGGTINNTTIGATTATTGRFTTVTSTVATGTAPITVSSTTVCPNLNASQLGGQTWNSPGTIGATTPSTGTFTGVGINSSAANANGLNFGSQTVASGTDLSKHIALWGTVYGFSITSNTLNVVSNSTLAGTFTNTGLNACAIGASTASTGAFTSLSATTSTAYTPPLIVQANSLGSSAPLTLSTSAQTTSGNVLTFSSTTGVAVGMQVYGTNINYGTTVSSTTSTTVTLSQNVTGTVANGASIFFLARQNVAEFVIPNSNWGQTYIYDWRNASGTTWSTASRRHAYVVDVSDGPFIEFNPPNASSGFGIGTGQPGSSTYGLYMSSTGAITTPVSLTSSGTITANTTTGSWSAFNFGKQLLVTTTGSANNPAIGITDTNGANLWAIENSTGTLNFCAMPAYSNSSTTPTIACSVTTTGINGTAIGATTASTGAFTSLTVNGAPVAGVLVQTTAPSSPVTGQEWFSTTDGKLYVYTGTTWAEATNETIPIASSTVAGAVMVSAGLSVDTSGNLSIAGVDIGRNKLHNPLFNIAQRGAGAFTASGYTLDRWLASITTDTVSITQASLSDADRSAIGDEEAVYGLQNVFTGNAGTGAFNNLVQRMEGVRRFSNKTVILSFWAKAASGTPKLGFNLSQNFGSGGSTAVTALATGNTVTLSTTWTRYTTAIAVPSASGKTLGTAGTDYTAIQIWFSSGSANNAQAGNIGVQSGTITLWGMQLEIGSVATALAKADPRHDLSNCQRFYYTTRVVSGVSNQASGGNVFHGMLFPTTMRATPTLALASNASTNLSSVQVLATGTNTPGAYFYVQGSATAAGATIFDLVMTATADL